MSPTILADIPPPAENAALAQFQLVKDAGAAPLVSDAKRLLIASYPKLHGRFTFAFLGHEDDETLQAAVDSIVADVPGWLQSMPDNFKTTTHALSRPKFGLIFVLKHDQVREALGAAGCASAIDAIERGWEATYKGLVIPKPAATDSAAPSAAGEIEGGDLTEQQRCEYEERIEGLAARSLLLERAVVQLLSKNYDDTVADLVQTLLQL